MGKNLTLAPVVKGLKEPTFVAGPPDGSKRLFVLEREGRVRVADANGQLKLTPFLDVSQNTSTSTEEGLLGLAFDPAFAQNGYVYVDYTANDASVQVVRYTVSPGQPDQVDPATAQTVLAIPKQSKYHNGGTLAFGPTATCTSRSATTSRPSRRRSSRRSTARSCGSTSSRLSRTRSPPSNPFVNQPGARGRDLVVRVPQPMAVQLRSSDRRPVDRRRRRRETVGGGRFPTGRQPGWRELRLADERRHRVHRRRALP